METVSKKRGRPKSGFHSYAEKSGVLKLLAVEGGASTRRNYAYQHAGFALLTAAGLVDQLLGDPISFEKGWQGMCVELGRWSMGGEDVQAALSMATQGEGPLSSKTRALKRLRVGEPDPDPEVILRVLLRTVAQIRQRFPGVGDDEIIDGLREAEEAISDPPG